MDTNDDKNIKEEKKDTSSAETAEDTVDSNVDLENEKGTISAGTKIVDFNVGDTIRIFYKIIEGDKLRTQPYEGIVIAIKGSDVSKTFTVRRIGADGVGIERIFPFHSPNIDNIKLIKKGRVRRAKLYYLRNKIGRAAMKIKEKSN